MVLGRPLSVAVAVAVVLTLMSAVWLAAPPAFAEPDVTLVEYASNPVYDPPGTDERAYYPCVLYDANQFSSHGASYYYKMWYSDGQGQFEAVTYSNNGINWENAAQTSGIKPAGYHAKVIYFPGGYSATGGPYFYKIWYWDSNVHNVPYTIDGIRTADSTDGVTWANDTVIFQNDGAKLVTGDDTHDPLDWNRGTYGPVSVLYNPAASNIGVNPFDYTYAMYYDGTTGGVESIGLGYSADGNTDWRIYGSDPVLNYGVTGDWDSDYVSAGTVIRGSDGTWRMWYSGSGPSGGGNQGIGFATSSDGLTWTKDADNPVYSIYQGVAWRDVRCYTPSVLYNPTRFDGHGDACSYKLWFTGEASATGNRTIGYAYSAEPLLTLRKNGSPAGAVRKGQLLTYTIRARNDGSADATGCSLVDSIPQYTAYVPDTTTRNGSAVPDVEGTTPLVGGIPVNSGGQPSGDIAVGEEATVTYQVQVQNDLPPNWPVSSLATLTGDGVSPVQATYTNHGLVSQSPTWYLAEGSTAWGYDAYISVENPNGEAVTATITYMTNSGKVSGGTLRLPANSQATVNPRDVLADQDFSTRVVCNEGKMIAVDRTMSWTGRNTSAMEAHNSIGVTSPAKTWYLAEGSSAWGFECWLLIQNPNARETDCRVTYMIEGGSPVTVTKTVPANSRATYNMADDIGEKDASIKVQSDDPVIPERAMYRNDRREGHDSIGTTRPALDYYLAEGTSAWGFTTYVLVQNPNPSSAEVTVTYMTSSGPKAQKPFDMPANSRKTIRVNDVLPNVDFSTRVHGSAPIIAERAMYWDNGTGEACHDSIGLDQAHISFYLPDGEDGAAEETFTLVQNPNATSVGVQVSYLTPSGAGNVTFNKTIPANSRVTFKMKEKLPDSRAAVVVECTTPGKRVIAERSMYWNSRGAGTDTIGGFSD